jgi:hypothetical protein
MRAGYIYTVAGGGSSTGTGIAATSASLPNLTGVAFDPAGNLLISDNDRLLVVAAQAGTYYGQPMKAGFLYQIAGGGTDLVTNGIPALTAELAAWRVATDQSGNVVLTEFFGPKSWIRVVAARTGTFYGQPMTAGDIYTVAGNGTLGYSGDGGPATAAEVNPEGMTVDAKGNVVMADGLRVRVVAAASGTFYGQHMTTGNIYTVAGNGKYGWSPDGTPALSAKLIASLVAVDPVGNILVGSQDAPNTVWLVAERAGSYYGKAVHIGDIYTIAHATVGVMFRDNCPAMQATFLVADLAVQPGSGNLLIAGGGTGRVRSVSR